jgi:hypothetical protein
MTIETANLIWNACYGSTNGDDIAKAWATYSDRQRREAIAVRDAHANGGWGVWNISDRD